MQYAWTFFLFAILAVTNFYTNQTSIYNYEKHPFF